MGCSVSQPRPVLRSIHGGFGDAENQTGFNTNHHDLKDKLISVSQPSGFKNRRKVYPINRNHVAKESKTKKTYEGKERKRVRKTERDTNQYDERSRKSPLIVQAEGMKRLEKKDMNDKRKDQIPKTHNLSDSKDGRKKGKRRDQKEKTSNEKTAHVKIQSNEGVLKIQEYQNEKIQKSRMSKNNDATKNGHNIEKMFSRKYHKKDISSGLNDQYREEGMLRDPNYHNVHGKLPGCRASLNGDRNIPESSRFKEMFTGFNDKVNNKEMYSNNDLFSERNAQKRNIETSTDKYGQCSDKEISRYWLDQNRDEEMSRARFEQKSDEDRHKDHYDQNMDEEMYEDPFEQNGDKELSRDWFDQDRVGEMYKDPFKQNSDKEMSRDWFDQDKVGEMFKDPFEQNSDKEMSRDWFGQDKVGEMYKDPFEQNSDKEMSRDWFDQSSDEKKYKHQFDQFCDEEMYRDRYDQYSGVEMSRVCNDQKQDEEISRDQFDQFCDEEMYGDRYDQYSDEEMNREWNDQKKDKEISRDQFGQFCDEEMYGDRYDQTSDEEMNREWNDQMKNKKNMCNNHFDQEKSRYQSEQFKDEDISTNWFNQYKNEMISKNLFGQYMNEEISRNWHDPYNTEEKFRAQSHNYTNEISRDQFVKYSNEGISQARYDQYGNKEMPRDQYDQYSNKEMYRDRYSQYSYKEMSRDRYDQNSNKEMPRDRYDQFINKEMSRNRYDQYSDEGMIQVRYGKYDDEETSTGEYEQYKNDRTFSGHGYQYDDSKLTENSSDKLEPYTYGGRKHTLSETVQNNNCKLQAGNVPEKTKHLKDTDNSFNKKKRNLSETYDYKKIDQHARQAPRYLKNSAEDLVAYLSKVSKDPRMLARSFFVWSSENIKYDVDGYFGRARSASNDAESVMKTGRSVCEGYARVFNLLCSKAGIPVKKVSGFSKGYGYSPSKPFTLNTRTDHAWNAVQLEGKWYLLDSTWGAGHLDSNTNMFKKEFNDFYFLTDPKQFVSGHFPYMDDNLKESQKWQLLSKPISLEEFNININYSPQAFKIGVRAVSHTSAFFEMKNELQMVFKSDKREDVTLSSELVLETRWWLEVQRNATFAIQENGVHKILVHPRQPGDYQLSIFGKLASDDKSERIPQIIKYNFKCIEVKDKSHEYPEKYRAASVEKCILHEPLKGNLPENTEIQFRITAPYLQHIWVEDTYLEKHGTLFFGKVTSPPKGYRFTMYGKRGEKHGMSDGLYAFHITLS